MRAQLLRRNSTGCSIGTHCQVALLENSAESIIESSIRDNNISELSIPYDICSSYARKYNVNLDLRLILLSAHILVAIIKAAACFA